MRLRNAAVAALAYALLAWANDVRADERNACVEAHTRGQVLRNRGRWVDASMRFRQCAAATCPAPVTADCTRWEQELRGLIPSVLVVARMPDGTDTLDAKLSIDGVAISDRLPTTALKIDPGEHVIRVERSGVAPVEERVVLREREQDRRVVLQFVDPSARKPAATAAPVAPTPHENSARSPALGIALVGGGGVALATGIVFGVKGKTREDELAGSCGVDGTCETKDVDVVRRDYWIAGIASGVGLAVIALGIWQLASRRNTRAQAAITRSGFEVAF